MKEKLSSLVWGIIVIAIGVLFGLHSLEIIDISIIFFKGWWTLFIIIPALANMIKSGISISNISWTIVGVALLLLSRDILEWYMISKLIIPFIIIMIGFNIILKNVLDVDNKKLKEFKKNKNTDYTAIFSGQKIELNSSFKGATVNAIFGGVELDLTKAQIEDDVLIDTSAIFGGVTIYVPNNVVVKVSNIPIFGGASNKAKGEVVEGSHTMYIKGLCIFGGIEIK